LLLLFLTMQTFALQTFLISLAVILILLMLVPLLLKFFARQVAPFAPNSEFAFLIVLALLCAFVTKQIGTYYLVGAFLVGVAAQQFQRQVQTTTSHRLIGAVELFASFFVPFYFFHSGTLVTRDDLSWDALWLAACAIAVVLPLRVGIVVIHRRAALMESFRQGLRVSVPMLPTLVFTLVLAQLLREHYNLDSRYYGALIIYAVASSLAASLIFKNPEPDFSSDLLEDGLGKITQIPNGSIPDASEDGQHSHKRKGGHP
jgi:Kef-type K+ transport system membrane component KefB